MKCLKCHIKLRYTGTAIGPINILDMWSNNWECPKCKELTWSMIPDKTLKVVNNRYK